MREGLPTRLDDLELDDADRHALALAAIGEHKFRKGSRLVEEGRRGVCLHVVIEGWVARTRTLHGGERQITNFYVAGEVCDLSLLGRARIDELVALTDARIRLIDRSRLLTAIEDRPRIGLLLLRLALAEQSTLRTWLTCAGRQHKREHVAHLICELHHRLKRAGLVSDHAFGLPLTQQDIADAVGITAVHMNRVLQGLRRENLIALEHGRLQIQHPAALRSIAEFDEAYLDP